MEYRAFVQDQINMTIEKICVEVDENGKYVTPTPEYISAYNKSIEKLAKDAEQKMLELMSEEELKELNDLKGSQNIN